MSARHKHLKDVASERVTELRRRLSRAERLVSLGMPDPDFIPLAVAVHQLVETLRAAMERQQKSGNGSHETIS
jgi:hypothetical protein